jgi:hypothetical protein
MAIKLADTLAPMSEFPAAMAEHIGFSDGATLQEKFDNKELGGGDSSVTLTQEEYEALTEEEKLDGLYYTYDTKRIYKNGVQYGASEPIPLTMEEYKTLKEAGAIDEQQEYLVEADAEGILLGAEDIGYNNTESGIQATTVQGAIDKTVEKVDNELATKLDKRYITGITDANNAIGENGVNIFVMSASSSNLPISRTGVIRSYTTIENKYIRVNQEYSTIDNSPQNGGTYKRYGASDDGGETFTWSNWNFVGSIDDSTTASLKTWSSSKIASQINNATAIKYDNVINPNVTKETGWNLAQGESHLYGRLLQLDGHLGSKSSTFSFLLFVKANYDQPTTVYATQLAGLDDDRSNIAHTTYFELGVSSSGNLTIKNKSAVTASYRFI